MTDLTNRAMSDEDYAILSARIEADILKIENAARDKKAANPKPKRRMKCGCHANYVCPRHRGEPDAQI